MTAPHVGWCLFRAPPRVGSFRQGLDGCRRRLEPGAEPKLEADRESFNPWNRTENTEEGAGAWISQPWQVVCFAEASDVEQRATAVLAGQPP